MHLLFKRSSDHCHTLGRGMYSITSSNSPEGRLMHRFMRKGHCQSEYPSCRGAIRADERKTGWDKIAALQLASPSTLRCMAARVSWGCRVALTAKACPLRLNSATNRSSALGEALPPLPTEFLRRSRWTTP